MFSSYALIACVFIHRIQKSSQSFWNGLILAEFESRASQVKIKPLTYQAREKSSSCLKNWNPNILWFGISCTGKITIQMSKHAKMEVKC